MKERNLIAVLIASVVMFSSCEKCDIDCNLVPANIIRDDCDRIIFQLLTNEIIGDAEWEDVQTGQRYSNVISCYNTCKIIKLTDGKKCTLYVRCKELEPNPKIPDCYRCESLSQHPPQTKVDFAEVSKSSCEVSSNRIND